MQLILSINLSAQNTEYTEAYMHIKLHMYNSLYLFIYYVSTELRTDIFAYKSLLCHNVDILKVAS